MHNIHIFGKLIFFLTIFKYLFFFKAHLQYKITINFLQYNTYNKLSYSDLQHNTCNKLPYSKLIAINYLQYVTYNNKVLFSSPG